MMQFSPKDTHKCQGSTPDEGTGPTHSCLSAFAGATPFIAHIHPLSHLIPKSIYLQMNTMYSYIRIQA